jgi:primosomal protein N' (replication factor Y)
VLTGEQSSAVAHLASRLAERAFRVVLLRGVTASGKTEVYLRAAEIALRAGGQVLVLVPEIGLSVQLVDRFIGRLGPQVAVLHSALTAAERRRQWEGVRAGEMPVVVGARSAIFAPLVRPALIIVDEEHEGAYKQDEVPRYHARDAAVVRGRMSRAVVVLGSATPSLESAYNAARSRYDLVTLEERVDSRPLPRVAIADLCAFKEEERSRRLAERKAAWARRPGPEAGTPSPAAGSPETAPLSPEPPVPAPPTPVRNLSPLLRDALARVLERGEQAILLVYRRGHSSFVQCTDCGAVARCPSCSVALTYHAVGLLLRCHHCNWRRRAPDRCPSCDGSRFWYGGVGTQRVEVEIHREFPSARILRMDLDSTRRRGAHRTMIEAFAAREADILLGTQMVAKGLDFPEVSLVGVVSADTLLNLPDFRSGERSFQLLTQVAGRAGRGPIGGEVIIQTFVPAHPSVVAAAAHDYEAFYAAAIAEREELAYPPLGAMARFHLDGPDEEQVVTAADAVCAAIGATGPDISLLGPAPLPLRRLRGRERWHVTLLGRERSRVHTAARRAYERLVAAGLPAPVRLQLDIDPVHLL